MGPTPSIKDLLESLVKKTLNIFQEICELLMGAFVVGL